jgi:hypothetical protein
MVNVTLSLPDDVFRRMKSFPEIRWSKAVRNVIEDKLDSFEEAERLAGKSRFSVKDVALLSKKTDEALGRHAEALLHETRR